MKVLKTVIAVAAMSLFFSGAAAKNVDIPFIPRKRNVERPLFVSFAQHKYNFNPTDSYYGKWIDRPLYLDPTLKHQETLCYPFGIVRYMKSFKSFADFEKTQEIASLYGLDAFAFSGGPFHYRALPIYDYADKTRFPEVKILSLNLSRTNTDQLPQEAFFDRILSCRNHLRINGKAVIWDQVVNSNYRKNIERRFGKRFLLINTGFPHVHAWIKKFYRGKITQKDVEKVKAMFRDDLRKCDGFRVSTGEYMTLRDGKNCYDKKFFEEFLMPILSAVFREAEFKDRYLVICVGPGHENVGLKGRGYVSHNGTKHLRQTIETALKCNADFIDLFEWDEVNENTHVQPTVFTGKSTMRIVRFYTARAKGQKLTPLPGDDISRFPNLCISVRKHLVYGEKVEVELLNIPESEEKSTYQVKVSLQDDRGKIVRSFPVKTMDSSRLYDETLVCPSENFAPARYLRPVLEITRNGKKITVRDGLPHIALHGVYNFDHTYVKQPLRDLLEMKQARFCEVRSPDPSVRRLKVKLDSVEPIKYVEAIDNSICIFAHGDHRSTAAIENGVEDFFNLPDPRGFVWRENSRYRVIEFLPMSLERVALNGTIRLRNGQWHIKHAPGKWSLRQRFYVWADSNTLKLNNYGINTQFRRFFLAIPRQYEDNAVIELDLKNFPKQQIPLKELLKKQSVLIGGKFGAVVGFHRYLRQHDHPMPLQKKQCSFEFDMIPNRKGGTFYIQAYTASGHMWRSAPIVLNRSGKLTEIAVYSDTQKKGIRVKVDSVEAPVLDYSAAHQQGALMRPPNTNRAYWGVAGGLPTLATLQLGGENDTSGPYRHKLNQYLSNKAADVPQTAPEIRDNCYIFSKPGMYLALHQGVMPRRAGFTLSFRFKVDKTGREQHIFRHYGHNGGSLSAFYIDEKGELAISYGSAPEKYCTFKTGVKVSAGKWTTVRLDCDMNHLQLTVNGVKGKLLAVPGCGGNDTSVSIGGFRYFRAAPPKDNRFFVGALADLMLRYDVPKLLNRR